MFFVNKYRLQVDNKTLTELQNECWEEIAGAINLTGVYGYFCNNVCDLIADKQHLIQMFGKYKNFPITNKMKIAYFKNYTFCFSSSLHSCHNFINISFRVFDKCLLGLIKDTLQNSGWDTTPTEVLYKIEFPINYSGEELWDDLKRLDVYMNEVCKQPVITTGLPTFVDKQGILRYSSVLPILPILTSEKKREDFKRVAKVDLNFLKQLLRDVSLEEPSGDESCDSPASGESSTPLGVKIGLDNAPQVPFRLEELTKKSKSPLQVTFKVPPATPTDTSALAAQSGGQSRPENIESKKESKLGDLQSFPYPVSELCNIYYIYLEGALVSVFKSLVDNGLKLKIGVQKKKKKRYNRWMSQDQFILHGLAWIAVIKQYGQAGKMVVQNAFKQWKQYKGSQATHCFAVQSFVLKTLKQLGAIEITKVNAEGRDSYSSFEERVFAKHYRFNEKVLLDFGLEDEV